MIKYTASSQLTLEEFKHPFHQQLRRDNRWVLLADLVPWDELAGIYAAHTGVIEHPSFLFNLFIICCFKAGATSSVSSLQCLMFGKMPYFTIYGVRGAFLLAENIRMDKLNL